jgi:hypothetical protein
VILRTREQLPKAVDVVMGTIQSRPHIGWATVSGTNEKSPSLLRCDLPLALLIVWQVGPFPMGIALRNTRRMWRGIRKLRRLPITDVACKLRHVSAACG